jgi:hypothetical protein
LLPSLLVATINHENRGKLAICTLPAHVSIRARNYMDCSCDCFVAHMWRWLPWCNAFASLLSPTGKWIKNLGKCVFLPFSMVEFSIEHHQFC